MGRARRLLLGVLLLAASVAAVVTAPARASGDGSFHVVGRNVIGPDGQSVVLRGVNKSGLEYSPWGYDVTLETFQRIKSWGANFVRIPLSPSFGVKGMCAYDKTYLSTIDKVVNYAEQSKLLVVLDDHFATKGLPCTVTANNQKAPDKYNLAFVKLLAARYKTHPYVAIDLYNEPHGINWTVWRKGGTVDGYSAVGMQTLLNAVRGTGFKHLVFASGNNWANDLSQIATTPLNNATNVIYAAHAYPFVCNGATIPPSEPYECEGKQYAPFLDGQVAPAIASRPVMLTEFGTQRAITSEMRAHIDWAEGRGIGWAAWLWCNGSVSNFCLLNPDATPSVTGQAVQDALFAANGWTTPGGTTTSTTTTTSTPTSTTSTTAVEPTSTTTTSTSTTSTTSSSTSTTSTTQAP